MPKNKYILKKISSILHAWDPIGGTPIDEYEDLSLELFRRLSAGASNEELIEFTNNYLISIVGLSKVNETIIATNISLIRQEYNKVE